MFIVDTNIVSELRRPRPHGAVVAWFGLQDPDTVYVPTVCFAEIQFGIERVRRHDPARAAELECWLDAFRRRVRIAEVTLEAFRLWARLVKDPLAPDSLDGMIAAAAMVHGHAVVTRNTRDFARFPVEIINPFES